MGRDFSRLIILILIALVISGAALGAPAYVGNPVPEVMFNTTDGKRLQGDDLHGHITVLEWSSPACPYSNRYYKKGIIQTLQDEVHAMGGQWITIYSSASGQPGYLGSEEEAALRKKRHASPTHSVLDVSGAIGHAFQAKTTPYIVILDAQGIIAYTGTVDNSLSYSMNRDGNESYVANALADLRAQRPVRQAVTRPYGCGIKYAQEGGTASLR